MYLVCAINKLSSADWFCRLIIWQDFSTHRYFYCRSHASVQLKVLQTALLELAESKQIKTEIYMKKKLQQVVVTETKALGLK